MLGASSAFWRLNVKERHPEPAAFIIEEPELGMQLVDSERGSRLIGYGEPGPGIEALTRIAETGEKPGQTMINREIYGALDENLRAFFGPHWGYAWDFFWSDEPLSKVEHCDKVEYLQADKRAFAALRDDIYKALIESNPITGAIERIDHLDWFILRADDGNIATVMGAQKGASMNFEGFGTVPEYRGHGYGGATMVGAVNLSLNYVPSVQFGVWAWNEGALRLYHRLGIHHGGGLITGRAEPFEELQTKK